MDTEDISDLDHAMFAPHPDGYICRCGLTSSCVCPSDFPRHVMADLFAEVERLRSGLRVVGLILDNARYAEAREKVIRLLA